MFNSVVITVVKVPLGLFISAMAAYALSRIRLPGSRAIFLLVLFGTMLPFQVMLAPLFTLVNGFGLINTKIGAILPYLAFGVPYQVFILHGFFNEVPKELSEAALVDGASHFTIFRRIFLPISLPVLAALLILDFVATWNEFAMALVILQDNSTWTLPLGLMSFQSQFQSDYGQLNAAIVMTVLPATIVYLIFQRYLCLGSRERRNQGVAGIMSTKSKNGACLRLSLTGPGDGNPFIDVTFDVEFFRDNRRVTAPGFYDGEGVYRVRFMPDVEGEWTYPNEIERESARRARRFVPLRPAKRGNHGPVRSATDIISPMPTEGLTFPLGQPAMRGPTSRSRCSARRWRPCSRRGFNKLRMAVFPKHYIYNENDPLYDVYQRGAERRA